MKKTSTKPAFKKRTRSPQKNRSRKNSFKVLRKQHLKTKNNKMYVKTCTYEDKNPGEKANDSLDEWCEQN